MELLLLPVHLGACRAERGFEFGGACRGVLEALLGQLTRTFGGLIALPQDLFEGLEEYRLQIERQQDDQNERRQRSQQYSAQLVQSFFHEFSKERRRAFKMNRLALAGRYSQPSSGSAVQ